MTDRLAAAVERLAAAVEQLADNEDRRQQVEVAVADAVVSECPRCGGRGYLGHPTNQCSTCGGLGRLTIEE